MDFKVKKLPIPHEELPERLQKLLTPVTETAPGARIEVFKHEEIDHFNEERKREAILQFTCHSSEVEVETLLDEIEKQAGYNSWLTQSSTFLCNEKGGLHEHPLISRPERHLVTSWGNGNHYTFNLSEEFWLTMGLTARCIGNEQQRLTYDDPRLPLFDVASGEISRTYHFKASRTITWTIRNDYLRKFLWQKGHTAVRSFFYECYLERTPYWTTFFKDKSQSYSEKGENFNIDIRQYDEGYFLQVWCTLPILSPTLLPRQDIQKLIWPGDSSTLRRDDYVYLNDKFLDKYESNSLYSTTYGMQHGSCDCSPSYKAQWSFENCHRVGRNLLRIPGWAIYKAVPHEEVIHAYSFAISKEEADKFDFEEEHIVSKVDRFTKAFCSLAEQLSNLGQNEFSPEQCIGISPQILADESWRPYPRLQKLAHIMPLSATERDLLSRCKLLHETFTQLKTGVLKKILRKAGVTKKEYASLASLKLLQAIINIVQQLNKNIEDIDSFEHAARNIDWKENNGRLAPFFINNDLRQIDAHAKPELPHEALEKLGFDRNNLTEGYGRAFDFILDKYIDSIEFCATEIKQLTKR